ncbi:tigger transposable element-derived protein 4-like [Leptopilina heterotoma]|uniref:tigger transposable element-derived protein 4-like n=1 Tax=Leptopilina heterotoma TaxID=63436 RepID=UPI001CA8364C|nr:tigger transposable element-derived protein 4-like [Leptopilina heterotoma]
MTSEIFLREFKEWDKELRKKDRQIVVFVDNCPAHYVTSVLQPMDQGVIKSFKSHYRRKLVLQFIENCEHGNLDKKLSLLEAIRFMAEAWASVSTETIKHCFQKSRICITENLTTNEGNSNDDCSLFDWIHNNNININTDNIDDYESIDNELIVSELPSDQEILLSIKKNTTEDVSDEEDENEDESCVQHISSVQALSALQTLSTFFETNNLEDDFFEHYNNDSASVKRPSNNLRHMKENKQGNERLAPQPN